MFENKIVLILLDCEDKKVMIPFSSIRYIEDCGNKKTKSMNGRKVYQYPIYYNNVKDYTYIYSDEKGLENLIKNCSL